MDALQNYISAVENKGSDLEDMYVYDFIVTLNSGGWTPRKKPTKHSKSG